ncbi:MAG: hypothetical protein ACRDG3_03475, partial [Tepidiformaceae bacterium]
STPAPAVFQAHSDASPTVPSAAPGARSGRHPVARGLYGDLVKQSGLTKAELQTGFRAGQSIDDVITANGGNPATVKSAVLADLATKLQAAVAANKLTQAKADAITAKAPAAIDALMSAKGGPGRTAVKKLVHARAALIKVAATTLNLPAETLHQDLKGGQTIAQVAGSQTAAVITAAQTKADAAIDTAVTNGKVSADKAATLKTKANQWISDFVNNGPKHRAAATTPTTNS